MANIPTAEQMIDEWSRNVLDKMNEPDYKEDEFTLPSFMIKFAQMHVQAALEAASEVHLSGEIDQQAFDKMGEEILSLKALKYNKKQILRAYPLKNIK